MPSWHRPLASSPNRREAYDFEGAGRNPGRERTSKRHPLRSLSRCLQAAATPAMAEGTQLADQSDGAELPEDLVVEVLHRLPVWMLLRFGAVNKAWRRRVSEPGFLLTHHLRQPAQPLLLSHRNVNDEGVEALLMALHYYCLEGVDLRAVRQPRMVVRFKDTEYLDHFALDVHGSCDGLLLLSHLDYFFVCNLATRQWAPLPPLRTWDITGLYAHAASREFRVLCQFSDGVEMKYYVLTVGSQQPARSIERRASSASVAEALARGLERSGTMPPVLLHGSLHWPPQPLQENNILMFDTAAETFEWMRPPTISNHSDSFLFETKEGKLALSCWDQNGWMAKLWIMQDYNNETWAFTYQIEVPVVNRLGKGMPSNVTIVSQDGDMLVEFDNVVLHYDNKGRLLQTFNTDGPIICFTRHMLKESLVPHPFLRKQQDGDPEGPPFFKGL